VAGPVGSATECFVKNPPILAQLHLLANLIDVLLG
jgi:hypothetical protein